MLTINREICEDLLCEKMNKGLMENLKEGEKCELFMTDRLLKKMLRPISMEEVLKSKIKKLKEENQSITDKWAEGQTLLHTHNNQVTDCEKEINKLQAEVEGAGAMLDELVDENNQLKEEAVENKKLFDTTFGEVMKLKKENEELKNKNEDLENMLGDSYSKHDIAHLNDEIAELKKYKDHSEKCWGDLSEEIDGERDAMKWAEVELRIKDLQEENENLHDQLEDTDDDELIDILGCQHCDRVEAVAQWRDDITDLREENEKLKKEVSRHRLMAGSLDEENKKLEKRATMWKYMSDYIEKSDPSAYWDFIRDEYPDEFVEAGGVIDSDEEVE